MLFFIMAASVDAYEFPPYQGIALKVLGNISGNYSNNVTFTSDKEKRIEDFRTMLNFGLDFNYTEQKRSMGFSGRVTRQIFEDVADMRNPSENVIVFLSNEFNKYNRISMRNTFTHSREPITHFGVVDITECKDYYEEHGYSESESENICNEFSEEFGRYIGRFDKYANKFILSYTGEINDKFSITPSYSNVKNWSAQAGTNDSDSQTAGVTVYYKYNAATTYFLTYRFIDTEYETGRDIELESIYGGIRQYITDQLIFNGNIGQDAASNGRDNFSAELSLSGEIDKRTSFSFMYSQGNEISANTNSTFENWKFTGRVSRLLLEDLSSSISAFYGEGDYSPTNITDSFLGTNISLSYLFWEGRRGSNMNATLGYAYSNLDSTDEGRNYDRSSASFGVTLSF